MGGVCVVIPIRATMDSPMEHSQTMEVDAVVVLSDHPKPKIKLTSGLQCPHVYKTNCGLSVDMSRSMAATPSPE